jgi:S1-C subfamily serine protease
MTKQDTIRRQKLVRLAIPAVVCLAAITAVAIGTKAWQGSAQNQTQAVELRGAWLGMRLAATDSRSAEELGVPATVKGVVIADVQTGSRAVMAGLAPGDVVTRVDGKEVGSLMDLYSLSTKLDVGRQLQVDYLRAGRPMAALLPPPEPAGPANASQWYGTRPQGAANDVWTVGTKPRWTGGQ